MTTVVNCKVKYIRPKYSDLKHWMSNPDNVYIGRSKILVIDGERYPKTSSIWANPFKITDTLDREQCISKYEEYIRKKISDNPTLVPELLALKGKTLGCWCKPEKCHGDVLIKLIEEAMKN